MKRIFTVILLVLLLLVPTTALALDLSEKIYDDANLLTGEEIANLQADALSIMNRHSLDAVVLIEEKSISGTYSRMVDFYDGNNFGVGEHGDGIMLYINMKTRDFDILTTGHAEPLYERHLDSMMDEIGGYLADAAYHTAIQKFLARVDRIVTNNGGLPDYIYEPDKIVNPSTEFGVSLLIGLGIGLVATLIAVARHKRSLPNPPSYHTYLGAEGLNEKRTVDRFVSTHTTRTARPKESSSSGGSSGGGRSHGSAGGRKF